MTSPFTFIVQGTGNSLRTTDMFKCHEVFSYNGRSVWKYKYWCCHKTLSNTRFSDRCKFRVLIGYERRRNVLSSVTHFTTTFQSISKYSTLPRNPEVDMKLFCQNIYSVGVVSFLFLFVALNTPASDIMCGFLCLFKIHQLMTYMNAILVHNSQGGTQYIFI